MSEVYRATNSAGQSVAVKRLFGSTKADAEQFANEIRAVRQIRHPNVVRLLDHGTDEATGEPYAVFECIDTEDLASRLARQKRLPVAEVVRIALEVADALIEVHEKGIIHRDIKPGNILFSPTTRRAKLIDFGIARLPNEPLTSGANLGTPAYMAPEQYDDPKNVGPASDVYGLAATLYHLISGQLPLGQATPDELAERRRSGKIRPLTKVMSGMPDALGPLLAQALAVSLRRRFRSAQAFKDAILRSGLSALPSTEQAAETVNDESFNDLADQPTRRFERK